MKSRFFQARKRIIVVSLLMALSLPVHALTVSECINIALASNEVVVAAEKGITASEARLREAVLNWFPHFSFSVDSYYYKKTPYQGAGGTSEVEIIPGIRLPANLLSSTGNEYYDTYLNLSVTQLLFDSGEISAEIAKARANLELSKVNSQKVKQDVRLEVTECYYELLKLDHLFSLQNKKVAHAKSLLDSTKSNYDEGKVGHLAVLEQKIELLSAKNELATTSEQRLQKKNELLQLLGLPYNTEIVLDKKVAYSTFSDDDLTQLLKKIKSHNLDIQEGQLKLKLVEYDIASSGSELRPTASLYGNSRYSKTADTLGESLKEFDRTWTVGLKLDWSFFDSGKTWNKVRAASLDYAKGEKDLNNTVAEVILEAAEKYKQLKSANRVIELREKQKQLAEAKLQVINQFYGQGRVSDRELEASEINFEEAKVNKLQALIDYEIAKIDLYQIIGRESQ